MQRREHGEPHPALGLAGTLFILPVFLQAVAGLSAFMTGVAFVPLTVALLVVSLSSARLSARIALRYLVPIGFLAALSGSILLRNVFSLNTQIVDIFSGTILIGVGLGLSLGPLNNLVRYRPRKRNRPMRLAS